jgi:hypothetical protein
VEDEDEASTELFRMYDAVKESEAPIEPKLVIELYVYSYGLFIIFFI